MAKSKPLDPIALALRNSRIITAFDEGASRNDLSRQYGLDPGQVARIIRQRGRWLVHPTPESREKAATAPMKNRQRALRNHKPPEQLADANGESKNDESATPTAGPSPTKRAKKAASKSKRRSTRIIKIIRRSRKPRKARVGTPSLLECAIQVLRKQADGTYGTRGMTPREIVETAIDKGLWKKLKGKTPDRTLWKSILSECKRGKASRLKKISPGHFGLTSVGRENASNAE